MVNSMIVRLLFAFYLLFFGQFLFAMDVLVITSGPILAGKFTIFQKYAIENGITFRYQFTEKISEDNPRALLGNAQMVIYDATHQNIEEYIRAKLPKTVEEIEKRKIPHMWMQPKRVVASGIDLPESQRLYEYYYHGGDLNVNYFMQALRLVDQRKSCLNLPNPIVLPESALYYPASRKVFTTPEEYIEYRQIDPKEVKRPIIAIAFFERTLAAQQMGTIDEMIRQIEAKGGIAWPFYAPTKDADAIRKMVMIGSDVLPNVLINTQAIFNPKGRRFEFEQLQIPVIQGMPYRNGTPSDWEKDEHGVSMMNIPTFLSQAELAGSGDIQIIEATSKNDQITPIIAQVSALVNKAINLAKLQSKANHEKKVTVFFYNYPPGEKNFTASYLNIPRSFLNMLNVLKDAGYDTNLMSEEDLIVKLQRLLEPFYREGKLEKLVADGLADTLSVQEYERWLFELPEKVRTQILSDHGDPKKSRMVIRKNGQPYFVIPRLKIGNIILLPQSSRADYSNSDFAAKELALYHDKTTAPTHGYLAMYLWSRTTAASDAIVHYGTHGTQEWLPGKERGLSVYDYPMLCVGDVPVVYPYIVDNIGEAIQAKRRGRATIISHQTPPFSPAGLHQSLVKMHDDLHAWLAQDEGSVKDKIKLSLIDQVKKEHIIENMGTTLEAIQKDFPAFIDQLHAHLHELAKEAQPLGLHTFGISDEERLRIGNVLLMIGNHEWESVATDQAEANEVFVDNYKKLDASEPYQWVKKYVINNESMEALSVKMKELMMKAKTYYTLLDASSENQAFLDALSGKYIQTSYGGDPIKNPDSLPTGKNLYGFDPSRIPTKAAWEAGKDAMNQLIAEHKKKHGAEPKKLTFSLWSVETMRHQGILEAQALYAMGVEPIWDEGGRVTDVKLIPRDKLNHERIDVVLSITGTYRDHFPNAIKHFTKAVVLTSEANESNNPIYSNTQKIEKLLLEKKYTPIEAKKAAQTRVFSSESGRYGSGLDDAVLATDTWNSATEGDAKLAGLYLSKMQYAYGPDETDWGKKGENGVNLYAEQLRGTDGALLSRSSNLYGMITSDDPFQYLGGIALSVRYLDGKAPDLYISNLRGSGGGKIEGADRFLSRELATRNFHPGYIEGQMKEGYAGTIQFLKEVNNFWGWTAVAKEIVRDDQWREFADVYVHDKHKLGLDKWFEKHNPHSQAQMIERMLEANRKGYWKEDQKAIDALKKRYRELASKYDVHTDNRVFEKFVNEAPIGYGMSAAAKASKASASTQKAQGKSDPIKPKEIKAQPPKPNVVKGMKLEKVIPQKPINHSAYTASGAGAVGLSILIGIVSGL